MPRNFTPLDRSPGVVIDIEGFVDEVVTRGVYALNATLTFTHERARKYAPVRSIFARTRRGPAFPALNVNRSREGGPTPAEVIQTYRRHPISTARRYNMFQRSLEPTRRINVPRPPRVKEVPKDRYGIAVDLTKAAFVNQIAGSIPPRGPTYGHSNSMQPVIRTKNVTVTGDLRQFKGGRLLPVATVTQIRGGKPKFGPGTGDAFLTERGRYEVRTGRAAHQKSIEEPLRIGGALRDSIVKVDATPDSTERGMIIGYVRAGGGEVDYAGYQEFGTRHNRPHPFLRPALYESRALYKRNMANALRGSRVRTR